MGMERKKGGNERTEGNENGQKEAKRDKKEDKAQRQKRGKFLKLQIQRFYKKNMKRNNIMSMKVVGGGLKGNVKRNNIMSM